jgi:hypothetical protein
MRQLLQSQVLSFLFDHAGYFFLGFMPSLVRKEPAAATIQLLDKAADSQE